MQKGRILTILSMIIKNKKIRLLYKHETGAEAHKKRRYLDKMSIQIHHKIKKRKHF